VALETLPKRGNPLAAAPPAARGPGTGPPRFSMPVSGILLHHCAALVIGDKLERRNSARERPSDLRENPGERNFARPGGASCFSKIEAPELSAALLLRGPCFPLVAFAGANPEVRFDDNLP